MVIETVIFTVNMQHGVAPGPARRGLVRAAFGSHAGGCQEWSRGRADLLDLKGWRHDGLRRPNLWLHSRFRQLDGYLDVLDEGGKVRRLPGRRAELGQVLARVTVLEDKETGDDTTLINFHLPAAIETAGRPRHGSPERVAMAERAIEHLADDYRAHDAHGVVYAFGDQNVDCRADLMTHHPTFPARQFAAVQAVPCWLGNLPPRGDGTHRRRLIDVVYTAEQAQDVEQEPNAGDHDGIRARYLREVGGS